MIQNDLVKDEDAISALIPNTEWHYRAGVLTVFTEGVVAPTAEEISTEKVRLEQVKAQAEAEAQAKRFAALAKLEALGLDEDDLKALGL